MRQTPPRVAAPPRAAPQRPQIVRPTTPAAPNRAQRIEQQRQQRQNAMPAGRQPAAGTAAAITRQQQLQERRAQQQEDRAERLRQRQENRALRALPPAQRAQRRQELQQQRAERAQQRQQQRQERLQQRQNVLQQTREPRQRAATRRNGAPRVNAQAIRQGRFAAAAITRANADSRADRRAAWQQARAARLIARQAWRRGHRATFVAWVGPIYWPYAYSDLFDYTFFPYAYEDDYWAYAYDDLFDGVFWADGGPYTAYAAAPSGRSATGSSTQPRAQARAADTTARQACTEPGQGITAWPFAQIQRAVTLSDEQKKLLADLESAAKQAADTFKASCATSAPLTPPGRLEAVLTRLEATLAAVQTVRGPLDAFYASLSDEQKARFNLIGPTIGQSDADKTARQQTLETNQKTCQDQKPGLVNLPIEGIEDTVKPTDEQMPLLDKLEQATNDAVETLSKACPDDIAQTPPGRLEQTETRLKAMIEAARTVQGALNPFYAALSDEQKSRFNTMTSSAIAADAD